MYISLEEYCVLFFSVIFYVLVVSLNNPELIFIVTLADIFVVSTLLKNKVLEYLENNK